MTESPVCGPSVSANPAQVHSTSVQVQPTPAPENISSKPRRILKVTRRVKNRVVFDSADYGLANSTADSVSVVSDKESATERQKGKPKVAIQTRVFIKPL